MMRHMKISTFQMITQAPKPFGRYAPTNPRSVVHPYLSRGLQMEANQHDREIVHGATPHRLLDQFLAANLHVVVILEPPPSKVYSILVREDVPYAITSYNQELVIFGESDQLELWFGTQGSTRSAGLLHAFDVPVAKSPSHGQLPVQVAIVDVATKGLDSFPFFDAARPVVFGHFNGCPKSRKHCPTVPSIGD